MTLQDRTKIRLFVEGELARGTRLALTGARAHYLAHVMRLGPGDLVRLFNGRDGEWVARIERLDRGGCDVLIEERLRPQKDNAAGPWLAFAPVKKDATDFVIVKATELGAGRLLPVLTRFTVAARVNTARMVANAREAAEQCGRLTVPEVVPPVPLASLIERWPAERRLFVCDASGGGGRLRDVFGHERCGLAPAFLIGPEGGLASDELDALSALPFVTRLNLGPRTLRAETAAIAVLACWQALAGDWTAL